MTSDFKDNAISWPREAAQSQATGSASLPACAEIGDPRRKVQPFRRRKVWNHAESQWRSLGQGSSVQRWVWKRAVKQIWWYCRVERHFRVRRSTSTGLDWRIGWLEASLRRQIGSDFLKSSEAIRDWHFCVETNERAVGSVANRNVQGLAEKSATRDLRWKLVEGCERGIVTKTDWGGYGKVEPEKRLLI
jgi:hypothetical protein